MRTRKSDQSYKIVKARSTEVKSTRIFEGKTFYWHGSFDSPEGAKDAAEESVKAHNQVRILDRGKKTRSGKRFIIYSRSIPYETYSKW